ncbi:hypothetical protein [Streptacidiphilus albus]|jgi:hypothetical protein|uniref:hypothetical protein n=1 Tax=Streptacidiphilus albus TaxID=105425 RepID=UPI00054B23B5|nr:hypothetical protein [Streptacidiphilus albus]
MADYQNTPVEDPSASTQMFRAFVDDPQPQPATAVSGGSRTGMITLGVIVALVVVIGVVYLAIK